MIEITVKEIRDKMRGHRVRGLKDSSKRGSAVHLPERTGRAGTRTVAGGGIGRRRKRRSAQEKIRKEQTDEIRG
jgi:hypothetical protein